MPVPPMSAVCSQRASHDWCAVSAALSPATRKAKKRPFDACNACNVCNGCDVCSNAVMPVQDAVFGNFPTTPMPGMGPKSLLAFPRYACASVTMSPHTPAWLGSPAAHATSFELYRQRIQKVTFLRWPTVTRPHPPESIMTSLILGASLPVWGTATDRGGGGGGDEGPNQRHALPHRWDRVR